MIRNATTQDFEQIQILLQQLETEKLDPAILRDIFLQQVEKLNQPIFVFEKNERILGFIGLRIEAQLHHAGLIAEILEFVVDHKERSQGIGKKLFQHACQFAKKQNCLQLEVACNQKRLAAHHFYTQQKMKKTHFKFSYPL